jgi:hypothetical protein
MNFLKRLFGNKSKVVLLKKEDVGDIIGHLKIVEEQQIAEQLRQLQESIYRLVNKVNDLSENLVQLTTTIEILQHESEEKDAKTSISQSLETSRKTLN